MSVEAMKQAQEAGIYVTRPDEFQNICIDDLERFAALVAAAERNKLIAWMMAQGYTYDIERDKLNEWMGYTASQGDATKDLLTELGWQIEQRIKGLMSDMSCQVSDRVKTEREACAKLIESRKTGANELMDAVRDMEARAIRARGQA
jgi:Spy/CpxP family protein refolding chaperone